MHFLFIPHKYWAGVNKETRKAIHYYCKREGCVISPVALLKEEKERSLLAVNGQWVLVGTSITGVKRDKGSKRGREGGREACL